MSSWANCLLCAVLLIGVSTAYDSSKSPTAQAAVGNPESPLVYPTQSNPNLPSSKDYRESSTQDTESEKLSSTTNPNLPSSKAYPEISAQDTESKKPADLLTSCGTNGMWIAVKFSSDPTDASVTVKRSGRTTCSWDGWEGNTNSDKECSFPSVGNYSVEIKKDKMHCETIISITKSTCKQFNLSSCECDSTC